MVIIGGRTRRSRANLGVTTAGRHEGRAEVALSVASAGRVRPSGDPSLRTRNPAGAPTALTTPLHGVATPGYRVVESMADTPAPLGPEALDAALTALLTEYPGAFV